MLDLTNFIEDEMTLDNDQLFSKGPVGQYEDKPLKPHKPKKIQSYAIKETRKETIRKQEKRNLQVPNI